jgi:hypothetical protein
MTGVLDVARNKGCYFCTRLYVQALKQATVGTRASNQPFLNSDRPFGVFLRFSL